MITPIDAVEWAMYSADALFARVRIDMLRMAQTLHIRMP